MIKYTLYTLLIISLFSLHSNAQVDIIPPEDGLLLNKTNKLKFVYSNEKKSSYKFYFKGKRIKNGRLNLKKIKPLELYEIPIEVKSNRGQDTIIALPVNLNFREFLSFKSKNGKNGKTKLDLRWFLPFFGSDYPGQGTRGKDALDNKEFEVTIEKVLCNYKGVFKITIASLEEKEETVRFLNRDSSILILDFAGGNGGNGGNGGDGLDGEDASFNVGPTCGTKAGDGGDGGNGGNGSEIKLNIKVINDEIIQRVFIYNNGGLPGYGGKGGITLGGLFLDETRMFPISKRVNCNILKGDDGEKGEVGKDGIIDTINNYCPFKEGFFTYSIDEKNKFYILREKNIQIKFSPKSQEYFISKLSWLDCNNYTIKYLKTNSKTSQNSLGRSFDVSILNFLDNSCDYLSREKETGVETRESLVKICSEDVPLNIKLKIKSIWEKEVTKIIPQK